jgi:hypothetical protein
MNLFRGRNRDFLSPPENIKVLQAVQKKRTAHDDSKSAFSVRQSIAEALNEMKFDDAGVGCSQELTLTDLIGQAYSIPNGQPEKVEVKCAEQMPKELEVALSTAMRYT